MLFDSLDFLLFVAAFFVVWPFVVGRPRARYLFLIAASLIFYAWWDWRFAFLLLGNATFTHLCSSVMAKHERWRTAAFIVALAGNFGVLGTFKYLDFTVRTANAIGAFFGLELGLEPFGVPLPPGISFFTFQSASYAIDVYRRRMNHQASLLHYLAYLSVFPQLVAGPIMRADVLMPQIEQAHVPSEEERWDGLRYLAFGYFKKVVIADNIAPMVDLAFVPGHYEPSALYWCIVAALFAVQLYCDFSAYSDIATGIGRFMGLQLSTNFNHPYHASSFSDFWGRWHISLSTWFRDYVYIPLGGSKRGALRTHLNLWVVMMVSGLWHGAAWTFVLWGALNALFLSFERVVPWQRPLLAIPAGRFAVSLVIFGAWAFSLVLFRAQSFEQALDIYRILFSFTGGGLDALHNPDELAGHLWWLLLGGFLLVEVLGLNRLFHSPRYLPYFVVLAIVASVVLRGPPSAFIYFRF